MRIRPPAKTFAAAAFYFEDSLTPAHKARDIHQYNAMAGLYHLAHALEDELASLKTQLAKIEKRLLHQE
jgi:hypothetical protein